MIPQPAAHKMPMRVAVPDTTCIAVPDDVDLIRFLRTDVPLLIQGGAGAAEAFARRMHGLGGWRHGPFVVVDCGWPDRLLESRLFGALRLDDEVPEGDQPRARPVQEGMVLLRDVGRLGAGLQMRLADRLNELRAHSGRRRFRRRLIASTDAPLLPRVSAGTFDACLYYRLNVMHVILGGDPRPTVRD